MIGRMLGPYRILDKLGEGGMGEVYRARDTRLDRTVAIKVLRAMPDESSGSARLRERFDREARTVSSLNHPHICTLHDIGREGDVDYLVMEYVDGETLAARLTRGPLPLEQALRVAIETADALARAHATGVIHRDLKPANIMLTRSGVKLLDFGIAKMRASDDASTAEAVTRSDVLTTEGTILGTIQYMAPEQLQGKRLDARTDIFAFGAVMYEMITGRPAFRGDNSASVIAAILSSTPDPPASLQPTAPQALDRLIVLCLAKDPEDRWQSSRDLWHELRWLADRETDARTTAEPTGRRSSSPARRLAIAAALLAAGALLGVLGVGLARWRDTPGRPPPIPVVRFPITFAPGDALAATGTHSGGASFDLSPDGSKLAYVVVRNGRTQLMLRSFDRLEAVALPGTEDAAAPFFSPDGEWIGFVAREKLKKIAVTGGVPLVICVVPPVTRGASWAPEGTIYLSPSFADPIFKVADSEGSMVPVTKLEPGEVNHLLPHVLPGGKGLIFTVWKGGSFKDASVWVWSAATGSRQKLLDSASAGRYTSTGQLVFARDGALLAVPFDLSTFKLAGTPVPLDADGVDINATNGTAQFALSPTGALVFAAGAAAAGGADLVWVDRRHREQRVPDLHGNFDSARLSPDGRRVAIASLNDIWVNELGTSTLRRLTFTGVNQFPVWTPDGTRIAFSRPAEGATTPSLFWAASDGSDQAEPIATTDFVDFPADWSPDGNELAFARATRSSGNWDILAWHRDTRQTSFIEHSPFNEVQPAFSPDGHWLAYVSDVSGQYEVYVRPYPESGARVPVSSDGGTAPQWGPDRELFYMKGPALMRVAIKTTPKLSAEKPELLFEGAYARSPGSPGFANYSVSKDGQRFLMIKPADSGAGLTSVTVVLGGFEAWKRRAR